METDTLVALSRAWHLDGRPGHSHSASPFEYWQIVVSSKSSTSRGRRRRCRHWGWGLSGLRPPSPSACNYLGWYLLQLVWLRIPVYLQARCCIEDGNHITMMPLNRLLFIVLWRIVCRHGMSVFGVTRTGLAIPILVLSWSIALVTSLSYLLNNNRRVVGQSRTEAWSQSSATQSTGQITW